MEPAAAPFSFKEEEFQLFQEDRRANNRFNKDRLALKEKLARIGSGLPAETVPKPWKMEIGSEHPAVWNQRQVDRLEVFFMRPEEDRKILSRALSREIPMSVLMQAPSPLYGHASLGFFIDERGIEIGFRVPFLAIGDRSQLRKLVAAAEWAGVLEVFHRSLVGYSFGVYSHGSVTELDFSRPGIWEQALTDLEKTGHGDHRAYLGLVKRFSVADLVAVEEIVTLLAQVMHELGPFAVEHSWHRERDLLGLEGLIAAQTTVNQAERVRSEQIRQELIQPRPVVARPIMTSHPQQTSLKDSIPAPVTSDNRPPRPQQPAAQRRDAAPGTRRDSAPEPRRDAPSGARRTDKQVAPGTPPPAPSAPRPPRPTRPPKQEKQPMTTVEPGAHVILAAGPFQGKEAVVLSELPDGQVRVRVGIMQMTVEMKDCLIGRD